MSSGSGSNTNTNRDNIMDGTFERRSTGSWVQFEVKNATGGHSTSKSNWIQFVIFDSWHTSLIQLAQTVDGVPRVGCLEHYGSHHDNDDDNNNDGGA